ncbi:AfsR/SARP family transcriptional regulator [Actinomadura rugatobispora]|uniref:Tetratricopeptide repeat protein n=1 Tax=Actinomadura rugatobispora TaxID=1994 RepID=A0ABW1AIS7_9ACTN|nr:BTAD domain-containing putative transcriptional regulator [Actinomadura rugatobispora]
MEFRVLGPLEVWSDGPRELRGWARERRILAILLMAPGRPVPTGTLVERLWDADRPDRARDLIYPSVARLRSFLHDLDGGVRLDHRNGAYVLDVDPLRIDYHLFLDLRAQARAIADNGDPEHALRLLRDAARLWRGEPLDGIGGHWAERRRQSIREELLVATRERLELELSQGRHSDITAELNDLIGQFPYEEKLVELLMLALHRDGRSGEALQTFDRFRRRLHADLGTSPTARVRDLHRGVLADDPALAPPTAPSTWSPPSDLPPATHTFTGRETELRRLQEMVDDSGGTVAVIAIDGMPGVGKSTLAVQLAHRLAERYPDGQIFLELRAHHVRQAPVEPAAALERLLRSIGVPQRKMPGDFDGRAALWRTELARRRLLLVLDDALDNDQVRPLLPGTPGCLVLITSRQRLTGLDHARPLPLGPLAPADSVVLLSRVAGPLTAPDAPGVAAVTRLCGHLPLALQLVGNRLRHRESWTAADLAARLSRPGRLDQMRAENRAVAAAFRLSVQGLDDDLRRAFLLLGLHPGTDVTTGSAAALLDLDRGTAETLLEGLLDHNLISEPRHGRHRFHDLIREYAQGQALQEADLAPGPALDRLLDHYLATADEADRVLFPHVPQRARANAPAAVAPAPIGDREQAREWLDDELESLVATARFAVEEGRARHAVELARALQRHLEESGALPQAAQVHTCAVEACRRIGDRAGLAHSLLELGMVLWRMGRYEETLRSATEALDEARALEDDALVAKALDLYGLIHYTRSEYDVAVGYYEQSLELWRSAGEHTGEAAVLSHVAIVLWHLGRYPEAIERMRRALALYEAAGDMRGLQITLNNTAEFERQLGRFDSALRHYERAARVREMTRQHQAVWSNNVASVYRRTNRLEEAVEEYRRALVLYREVGDVRGETDSLNGLGSCYARLGRDGEALFHHQKALQLARRLSEKYEQGWALREIGDAHHRAGKYGTALEHLEEALALARAIGDANQEANALSSLGEVVAQTRGPAEADQYRRKALELYEALGLPEAAEVQARIGGGASDASGS